MKHKVFPSKNGPNNVEYWLEDYTIKCVCDYPISLEEQRIIEDLLGLYMYIGFRFDFFQKIRHDGKWDIEWSFLDKIDMDWS